jgi:hypothetical protein
MRRQLRLHWVGTLVTLHGLFCAVRRNVALVML